MLKKFKQAALRSLKTSGVSSLVQNSRWRRERLLILAYHGISLVDEHVWNGSQFLSPEILRTRFEMLRRSNCAVLPLGEAVERLYANDLPDRAVAITFDDGTCDFYRRAFPLIQEFAMPVTLYLTTFYSYYQRPVFDLMCSYLLWKARSKALDLKKLTGQDIEINLSSNDGREAALTQIHAFAGIQKLSADAKDAFATAMAKQLRVDYDKLIEQRMLHNLTATEVSELAGGGIDVQLHTHRHRTPMDRQLFLREIEDNRKSIQEMTGISARHFCYPSGRYQAAFLPWLKEAGVLSATTCERGFASRLSNPLELPRLLDSNTTSAIEFEGWLTGVSAILPHRRELKESAA
jgi:peptidoglycan/xylan/chitin deacetylase (PgdA/CDA1 family)